MTGLEYICKQENMNYTELAKELGVTRQAINNWIKAGRKIPDKQLEKLEALFTLDAEWFNRELDADDEVKLYYLLQQNNENSRDWYTHEDETIQRYKIEKMEFLKELEKKLDDLYEQRVFEQKVEIEVVNAELKGIFKMIKTIPMISQKSSLRPAILAEVIMSLLIANDERLTKATKSKFVKMLVLAIELENNK